MNRWVYFEGGLQTHRKAVDQQWRGHTLSELHSCQLGHPSGETLGTYNTSLKSPCCALAELHFAHCNRRKFPMDTADSATELSSERDVKMGLSALSINVMLAVAL